MIDTLGYILTTLIVATFLVASYFDIKTRTIPFRVWYPLLIFGPILLLAIGWWVPAYIIFTLAGISLAILGYRLGLYGGADLWAFVFLCIFVPRNWFAPLLVDWSIFGFLPLVVAGNMAILCFVFVPIAAKLSGIPWKTYRVPYIVPLTAGLIIAILTGA